MCPDSSLVLRCHIYSAVDCNEAPVQRSKEPWSSPSVRDDTTKQRSKEQPADPADESSESNLVIFLPQSFNSHHTVAQKASEASFVVVPVNRKQVR